jgi:pimeloyl-ACP methyl ester carboxylesterase
MFAVTGRLAPGIAARLAAELLTRPRGHNPAQPWEHDPALPVARHLELSRGLHALAWGGSGPVVLAQHGWRGRPTQFGPLAAVLLPRGIRLVALDAPGHGRSAGARATPRRMADALLEAAAALGGIEALVGHSLGGSAAAIAVEVGLRVRRLALLATPTRPSVMISNFADQVGLPPRARRLLDAWFDRHAGRPVAQLDPVEIDLPPDVEALVVHDTDDDVIPVEEARRLQVAWPAARFLYTTGLGHRELLADAGVLAALADFLVTGAPPPSIMTRRPT